MNVVKKIMQDYPIAVVCVVVILLCSLAIFLRADVANQLSITEAELNSRIRTIDQNIKNSKDLEKEVAELKVYVDEIESRVFDPEQRAVNVNFFYALEDRLDVRISDISQLGSDNAVHGKGGPKALSAHSTIGYSISLSGQFDEILAFFYELNRVDAFIRVASFQMASTKTGAGIKGQLEVRLKLLVLGEKN